MEVRRTEMNFGTTDRQTHRAEKARHLPGTLVAMLDSTPAWQWIKTTVFLPLLFIFMLAAGMVTGALSQRLSGFVNSSAAAFIDWYSLGAPALIFIVLAPVLSRILSTRRRGRFGVYVISWLAGTKTLALLRGVLFTVAVFRLPIMSEHSASVGDALLQTARSVLNTLTVSHFFWAIYAAVATGLIATRIKPIADVLERGVTSVEYLGQYIQPIIRAVSTQVSGGPDRTGRSSGPLRDRQHPGVENGPKYHHRGGCGVHRGSVAGRGSLLRLALRASRVGEVPIEEVLDQGLLPELLIPS